MSRPVRVEDRIRPTDQEIQRFWSKVALPDENGCMLWMSTRRQGYGQARFRGHSMSAHRVSLLLAVGKPADDQPVAAHACRNRHCVAPAHLRWATHLENRMDQVRDDVVSWGERHYAARLTDEQVLEILSRSTSGVADRVLAEEYGVTGGIVRSIRAGLRWRHLLPADYAPASRWNGDKTHCPSGHEYTEANTYRAPGSPDRRHCRACLKARRK